MPHGIYKHGLIMLYLFLKASNLLALWHRALVVSIYIMIALAKCRLYIIAIDISYSLSVIPLIGCAVLGASIIQSVYLFSKL